MYFISNPAYALKHFVYNACIYISISVLEMPGRHKKLLIIATGKEGVRKGRLLNYLVCFRGPCLKGFNSTSAGHSVTPIGKKSSRGGTDNQKPKDLPSRSQRSQNLMSSIGALSCLGKSHWPLTWSFIQELRHLRQSQRWWALISTHRDLILASGLCREE